MATEAAPVETAPIPTETAPEAQTSSAVDTTPLSTSEQLAEADREFHDFYNRQNKAPEADAGTTEEPVEPPAGEPAPNGDQPETNPTPDAEVQTPPVEEEQVPEQIRPRLKDAKDIAIASLQKARGLPSFYEAALLYAKLDAPEPKTVPGLTEQPAASAEPSPVQRLESDIAALAEEIANERKSDDAFLTPEHQEKRDRLAEMRGDLRLEKYKAEQATRETQARTQSTQERFLSDWEANRVQAEKEYADIINPDSLLSTCAAEVRARWERTQDPRMQQADAPLLIVREAAERAKRFAPVPTQAPAATKSPVPLSSQPAPKPEPRRVQPAPGNRGQQSGNQPSSFGQAVAEANTLEELDAVFKDRHGQTAFALGGR